MDGRCWQKQDSSLKTQREAHTNSFVIEDLGVSSVGVFPSKLPHIKEGFPVDEVQQTVQIVTIKHTSSQELRAHCNTKTTRHTEHAHYQLC